MTTGTPASNSTPHRSRWLRRIGILGSLIVLLSVLAYFVGTSRAFVQSVVLPRVGEAMGVDLAAEVIAFSPFSSLTLRNLKVHTTGKDPLLTIGEMRIGYRLGSLLAGEPEVDELRITDPTIQIVEAPDGSSNLDPLTRSSDADPEPTEPPRFILRNVTLTNGVIRWTQPSAAGHALSVELNSIEASLDQLAPGAASRLSCAYHLTVRQPTANALDTVRGRSLAQAEFTLDSVLIPQTGTLQSSNFIEQADGRFADLAGVQTVVEGRLTPGEIPGFNCRFLRQDRLLGETRLSGPFDLAQREGTLTLRVDSLDRQVLNLVGAPWAVDFGDSRLSAILRLDLSRGGSVLGLSGRIIAQQLGVAQGGKATPPLDLQLEFDATVQPEQKAGRLQIFRLEGRQKSRVILKSELSRPISVSWARGFALSSDTTFTFSLDQVDLAEWTRLSSDILQAGLLDLHLDLVIPPDGRRVTGDLSGSLSRFSVSVEGAPRLEDFTANFELAARLQDSLTLRLEPLRLNLDSPAYPETLHKVQLTGELHLTTNAHLGGTLQLAADSIDLTPFYDLFASLSASPPAPAHPPAASTAPASSPTEPDPLEIPVGTLTLESRVGRLRLRELTVSNFLATINVASNRFTANPVQASIGGAPASARGELDLGTKGWSYNLAWHGEDIPLEPIVNTFYPAYAGQYRGSLQTRTVLGGQGITGPSLQRNLNGQIQFTFTNAQIQLVSPAARQLLLPVAALLHIERLTESPLDWLDASARITNGQLRLDRFALQSAAFNASTTGTIPLAQNLSRSRLDLPVSFALRRSLAQKAGLMPTNAAPGLVYVPLPDFVTVRGTLDQPKSDLKEAALSGLLLKSGLGIAERLGVKIDDKTDRLLRNLGDVLTGDSARPQSTTSPQTTNAPLPAP